MSAVAEVGAFLLGALVVLGTCVSAVGVVVVPRGIASRLARVVFRGVRRAFDVRVRLARSYEARDRAMALYAPVALVLLPVVWLTVVLLGYTAMFWAIGVRPLRTAFVTSGSSLLTLGFATVPDLPSTVLAFTEAVLGLLLLALLITYLPSMYAAFSRRELRVTMLAIQAGEPPSPVEMLQRFNTLRSLEALEDEVWRPFSEWFTDLEESHTSLSAVTFFRSPAAGRSWVGAAGTVLDAAALYDSTVDAPRSPAANLMLRSGYLSLRAIADFFRFPFDPDPAPDGPISVRREEWDAVVEQLAAAGVPLEADREQAWRDFVGWRVNYDTVLLSLAGFVVAPPVPWVSDRPPVAG